MMVSDISGIIRIIAILPVVVLSLMLKVVVPFQTEYVL